MLNKKFFLISCRLLEIRPAKNERLILREKKAYCLFSFKKIRYFSAGRFYEVRLSTIRTSSNYQVSTIISFYDKKWHEDQIDMKVIIPNLESITHAHTSFFTSIFYPRQLIFVCLSQLEQWNLGPTQIFHFGIFGYKEHENIAHKFRWNKVYRSKMGEGNKISHLHLLGYIAILDVMNISWWCRKLTS